MSTWKALLGVREKIRTTPVEELGSVALAYPSPYQIPDAFRVSVLEDAEQIHFRYDSDDEATRKIELPRGVVIVVGRNSGRLHSVQIPVELLRGNFEADLPEVASGAIDELRANPALSRIRPQSYRDNYRIAQDLLRNRELSFAP